MHECRNSLNLNLFVFCIFAKPRQDEGIVCKIFSRLSGECFTMCIENSSFASKLKAAKLNKLVICFIVLLENY